MAEIPVSVTIHPNPALEETGVDVDHVRYKIRARMRQKQVDRRRFGWMVGV